MRFDVISILPEIFAGFTKYGVCGRAFCSHLALIEFWNPRNYAPLPRQAVDDRPFGGGSGMVLSPPPIASAIEAAQKHNRGDIIYLAPRGELLNDAMARQLAQADEIILLCGRYRGVDERVIEQYKPRCISVGDYILSGGEVAAMALIEAVLRHRKGVLGNADSADEEAFFKGILDAPCYTRPEVWKGRQVPKALLSGDHSAVNAWRRAAARHLTQTHRPDMLKDSDDKDKA